MSGNVPRLMNIDPSEAGIPKIQVRKCSGIEEFSACVALQKEIWKFADIELFPLRMFVVAEKVGGQIIGAFEDNTLVGYVLSIPGIREGHSYLHSQMLAVRESYRNCGLGRMLKLAQRKDAIERGFDLIEWTFDPLEIKNAWLNMMKLGAIARRYYVNHYGYTSSVLHQGLPTDRLIAEWWLKSNRVVDLLDHGKEPVVQPANRIIVPAEIYRWRASSSDLAKAKEVQERNREEFLQAFSRDLAVLGYERDNGGNGAFLLGKWEENPISRVVKK